LLAFVSAIGVVLLLVQSTCWRAEPIRWRPIQELSGDSEQDRNVLVVYYSTADPATYLHRRWVEENGGDVICQHGVETFGVDQRVASPEHVARMNDLFDDFTGSTGVGVISFQNGQKVATWNSGQFTTKAGFERWVASAIEQ